MWSFLLELVKSKSELCLYSEELNVHVAQTFKQCLEECYTQNQDENNKFELKIESVIDFLYEELNTGHWSEVPLNIRRAYSSASFVKAILILKYDNSREGIKKALKCIDMGLLLGAPLDTNQNLLIDSASHLTNLLSSISEEKCTEVCPDAEIPEPKRCKVDDSENFYINCNGVEIPSEDCPSLQHFNNKYFMPQVPVKIRGCMSHWPASSKWLDVNYLIQKAGSRTVPVEIGSQYVDEDWSQKLMTLGDFIKTYYSSDDSTGYVAQHNLFDQISELKEDICVPEYCCLSRNYEESSEPDINAWFGPKGTVSPLHFDPKDNLLAQVFGTKQILLFSPTDSEFLYPHEDLLLFNTSRVDPTKPNLKDFPLFDKSNMFKCLLKPGEMLYIPPKWWHHVTALGKSFSVSFWWQ